MAIKFVTTYPDNLKDAHWQSSKSKLDKVSKSGLGPLLKKAEADWKAVSWDAMKAARRTDDLYDLLGGLKVSSAKAKAELDGPVKTAYNSLKAASEKAFKVSKQVTLSKGAADVAKTMSTDLQKQSQLLKGIKLDDWDKALSDLKVVNNSQDAIYDQNFSKIQDGLAELRIDPSHTGWGKANLKKRTGETNSHILSAIQVGRTDFRTRKETWFKVVKLTNAANDVVKGTDAVADKKVIKSYITQMVKLLG